MLLNGILASIVLPTCNFVQQNMTNKISNLAILTSGGDAPGMNAAIRAVVLAAEHYQLSVMGISHGYNGLINQEIRPLTKQDVHNIIHQGGTILKSARCREMMTEQGVKQAASTLRKNNIDALVVIGGDGSFKGLLALQEHWQGQVIGLPGTIDNDLDGTDHTIGFATAVDTAIHAIDKIRDTADAFERVFIVELMGRHSGHITFNVGLACAAEQILSFENTPQGSAKAIASELAEEIKLAQKYDQSSYIICVAENLIEGGATALATSLQQDFGIDATACILGYIQRGGSPVAKDRIMASKMGVAAVEWLLAGKTNLMIGEQNQAMAEVPLLKAIAHQKTVANNLICTQSNIFSFAQEQ